MVPMRFHDNSTGNESMPCDLEELSRSLNIASVHTMSQVLVTLSVVAMFIGTRTIYNRIRRQLASLTVVVVGAGPIGMTSALIAAQCKRITKIIIYEEQARFNVANRSYQITLQPAIISFLRSYGVDFDNLEGLWENGFFYTRVGIYLEYIMNVLPLYKTEVVFKFNSKFNKDASRDVDEIPGRVLVVCCDGTNGPASSVLGISDACVQHPCGVYGAVAALERQNQTMVPTPERRVHNLSFDLSAYGGCSYEEAGSSQFSLKLFGNSKSRFIALAVHKSDSKVVKSLKTILDKSMMRNIFLKCFNTYKGSGEPNISDSYCLNNMKFSPRLFEIKVTQRAESVAYIADCDMFVVSEGESARSYNFNTGMDVNVGLKGLAGLKPFIHKITLAETEHSIMQALIFKMEHSDKVYKGLIKHGLREYIFL